MILSHVQSLLTAKNQLRSESKVKTTNERSLHNARLFNAVYTQSSMSRMLGFFNNNSSIIEQFRLHRETIGRTSAVAVSDDDDASRRRLFYIREHKLAAISYAIITYKKKKDESIKLISKYAAIANLEIITAMLRQ